MKEDIYTIYQESNTKKLIHFTICGITHPDRNYEIYREKSKTACIEYIEKGTGVVNVNDASFSPSEGDSYFLHVGEKHHYYSDKNTPWKKYFINLSGTLLENLIEGYSLKEIHYFPALNIKEELCTIIKLSQNNDKDNTKEIISILNGIFFKMHNSIKHIPDSISIAENMKNYLNSRISEKFKISDLCKYISRSESQTIRIFKTAYGITPYTYILNKKIDIAKNLLLNTNLTVKEISYKLSFSDEYYFSNLFKSKTGLPPTEFRNNQKKTE